MMEILTLLLNPTVLSVLTPAGAVVVGMAWSIFKLAKRYDNLQEKRIEEIKQMKEEYMQLSVDINKTLDILIQTIGKRNGNGSNGGGNK